MKNRNFFYHCQFLNVHKYTMVMYDVNITGLCKVYDTLHAIFVTFYKSKFFPNIFKLYFGTRLRSQKTKQTHKQNKAKPNPWAQRINGLGRKQESSFSYPPTISNSGAPALKGPLQFPGTLWIFLYLCNTPHYSVTALVSAITSTKIGTCASYIPLLYTSGSVFV